MLLSSELIATDELCPRRVVWSNRYQLPRVSLMGALYRAVDAGLRAEKDPERAAESEFIGLASRPGLDVTGPNVYAIGFHHAKLAGILSVALRSAFPEPWKPVPDAKLVLNGYPTHPWRSACYDAGDGAVRRVVLVDRWSDDRKAQEARSWRTIGEACALRKPILLTAVTIGGSKDGRRSSPWTRCYQHPKSRQYRFKRKTSTEDFGATWKPIWREDAGFPTADWLTRMKKDGCMADVVDTLTVPMPTRRDAYVQEMMRHAGDMQRWHERLGETPPMRLAGCYGWSPCVFLNVCHGSAAPSPEAYNFVRLPLKSAAAPSLNGSAIVAPSEHR